jgi:hypothetical protein
MKWMYNGGALSVRLPLYPHILSSQLLEFYRHFIFGGGGVVSILQVIEVIWFLYILLNMNPVIHFAQINVLDFIEN